MSKHVTPTLPFLKWAGGKRWLCGIIDRYLPKEFERYLEPFLGGGAVFFHLAPARAILTDINGDLINAYVQVRDRVDDVIAGLKELRINRTTYLRLRSQSTQDALERAIRFIYLNKTAFNGLYRVNRKGAFNVPFAGNQGRSLFDELNLWRASALLQGRTVTVRHFTDSLQSARKGDLIYCDPPYTVQHNNNGFVRYNESLFSWIHQEQLARAIRGAVERGAFALVSNAEHQSLRRLYRGFSHATIKRASCMSGVASRRGTTSECLFIGDPQRI